MSLATQPVIIGSHLFFFPNLAAFTVPGAGTCGAEVKPGAADPAWLDLGPIAEGEVEPQSEEREIFGPGNTGVLELVDILENKLGLTINCTLEEYGPLVSEMLFLHDPISGGAGQATPARRTVTKKGWLKIQMYDNSGSNITNLDLWVQAKLSSGMSPFSGDTRPQVTFRKLRSSLNTMEIA
jgi:hypothetical protein